MVTHSSLKQLTSTQKDRRMPSHFRDPLFDSEKHFTPDFVCPLNGVKQGVYVFGSKSLGEGPEHKGWILGGSHRIQETCKLLGFSKMVYVCGPHQEELRLISAIGGARENRGLSGVVNVFNTVPADGAIVHGNGDCALLITANPVVVIELVDGRVIAYSAFRDDDYIVGRRGVITDVKSLIRHSLGPRHAKGSALQKCRAKIFFGDAKEQSQVAKTLYQSGFPQRSVEKFCCYANQQDYPFYSAHIKGMESAGNAVMVG